MHATRSRAAMAKCPLSIMSTTSLTASPASPLGTPRAVRASMLVLWQAMHVCNSYTAVASHAAAHLLLKTTNAVLQMSPLVSLPAAVSARTDILFLDSPKRPMVLRKLLSSLDQVSTISFSLCLSDKHKHVNATTAPMNHSPCTPCFVAMIRRVWKSFMTELTVVCIGKDLCMSKG